MDELAALRRLPLADQVAAGIAWSPLSVEDVEPAGRGHAAWLLRAPKGTTLHEGLDTGELVDVGGVGAAKPAGSGRLVAVEGRMAVVRMDARIDAPDTVSVVKRHDRTSFARLRQALTAAPDTPVARVLLGLEAPQEVELPGGPPEELAGLDPSQQQAAMASLATQDLALVHGPPGTGKTRMLTALLDALLARGERPWALADSNAAVDNLAVRASRHGLHVLRLGHPGRMGGEAAALSLDARVKDHAVAPAIRSLDKELSRARSRGAHWRDIKTLYQSRDQLVDEARASVIANAQVYAITLGSLARYAGQLPRPGTAVVDEATQATEPSVWTAVPFVDRLVLVGDPHQLGPVVFSPNNPLERPLLARLLDRGLEAPMLRTQYRMHHQIASTVTRIYGESYRPHPSVAERLLDGLQGVTACEHTRQPVHFVDTAGAGFSEELDARSGSRFNRGELKIIAAVVGRWRAAGLQPEQIGVITPYSAQVARLAALPELQGVEVATVNAFQGREKEAIAVSFVRSNEEGAVGFVSDPRRLTVSLTRARRAWLGVGDSATLSNAPGFVEALDAIDAVGGLDSVWSWDLDL